MSELLFKASELIISLVSMAESQDFLLSSIIIVGSFFAAGGVRCFTKARSAFLWLEIVGGVRRVDGHCVRGGIAKNLLGAEWVGG